MKKEYGEEKKGGGERRWPDSYKLRFYYTHLQYLSRASSNFLFIFRSGRFKVSSDHRVKRLERFCRETQVYLAIVSRGELIYATLFSQIPLARAWHGAVIYCHFLRARSSQGVPTPATEKIFCIFWSNYVRTYVFAWRVNSVFVNDEADSRARLTERKNGREANSW